MTKCEFISFNAQETMDLAGRLARIVSPGSVVALRGDLGAGKTCFAQGFLAGLGVEEAVTSPTFNLVQIYDTDQGEVWHADLYRVEDLSEIENLGLEDVMGRMICLIEWPDRMESLLPAGRIEVMLAYGDTDTQRRIEISGSDRIGEIDHDAA